MPVQAKSRSPRSNAIRNTKSTTTESISQIVEQLVVVGKLLLVAALFVFVAMNWSFFSGWLQSIRHVEGFGLKFDRYQTEQNIKGLRAPPPNGDPRNFDDKRVLAAVKHAALLGRAIQGAKILWVDWHPDNNLFERRILEEMGISVQLAWSTEEAMRLLALQDASPDLVISNIMRTEKQTAPLSACAAAYYEFPDDKLRVEHKDDIWRFNAAEQAASPGGFVMAELMAKTYPEQFGDHQRPRIIFYTSSSGGKAADACARIITNRPDVLLENVVSALAAFRSAWLPEPAVAPSKVMVTAQ